MASRMMMKKSDGCPLSETLKAPHFYRRRNLFFSIWWCFLWVFNHVQTFSSGRFLWTSAISYTGCKLSTAWKIEAWEGKRRWLLWVGLVSCPLEHFGAPAGGVHGNSGSSLRSAMFGLFAKYCVSLSVARWCSTVATVRLFVWVVQSKPVWLMTHTSGRYLPSMSPEHQSTRCTVQMQTFN